MRSAYYLELDEQKRNVASTSEHTCRKLWKCLWATHIPQKVKMFWWRALQDGITTRETMFKRGIDGDRRCPMCGEGNETIMHTLPESIDVQRTWKQSPLRLEIMDGNDVSLTDWCLSNMLVITDAHWWSMFWCILWNVWLRRNAWIFRQKRMPVETTLATATSLLSEYLEANGGGENLVQVEGREKERWTPPQWVVTR